MKRLVVVAAVFVFCMGLSAGNLFAKDEVMLRSVTGNVKVTASGKKVSQAAKAGDLLEAKDIVRVGADSGAVLIMNDGTEIRLNQKTIFVFESLSEKKTAKVATGQIWANVAKGNNIVFKTPSCTAAVRGTKLDIKVSKESSEILVYEGIVMVSNQFGTREIVAKPETGNCQQVVATVKEAPSAPAEIKVETVAQWQDKIAAAPGEKEEPKTDMTKEKEEISEDEEVSEDVKDLLVVPDTTEPPVEEASPSSPQ